MEDFLGRIKHFSVEPAVRNLYRNDEQNRLKEQTDYNRKRDALGDFRYDQRLAQQNEDRAFQRGRQLKQDARQDRMFNMKLGAMNEAKEGATLKKQHDHLARVAYLADTPEKWARMTGALKNKGFNFGDQYNDFASRESVLAEYGDLNMIKSLFKGQGVDPLTQSKIDLNRAKIENYTSERLRKDPQKNAVLPQLLSAVGGLESKIGMGPNGKLDKKKANAFEHATGPYDSSWLGETLGQVFHADEVTLLRQVRQDSQAVRSLLQKALLKGGGSITENERDQVNQILGSIETARSAKQAISLVRNFKSLVNNMFSNRKGQGVFKDNNPRQLQDPLGIR